MVTIEKAMIGLVIIMVIIVIISFRRLKQSILNVFGGSIEAPELAGVVLIGYLGYMLYQEAHITNLQFHVYNELYIFFIAGGAMTGLGLNKVLEAVKDIRGINTTSSTTKIEVKEVKNESEAPQ